MPLFDTYPIHLYNSLKRKKELFKPINSPFVGMYVCGPTVYNFVHLGNCRTFISFDLIYRFLTHLGYKVRYVRNITDAGHLENDSDDGQDKISKKAQLEQLEPMEIVQRYTLNFHKILDRFNTIPPSIEPTATGHIVEQINMIQKIIKNGFAYEINGSVYFDVEKYNINGNYGKLSGRNIQELHSGTRELENQGDKKNSLDFALWKKASENHIMRWNSPWGEGFPGWHLECSVMSNKYLGESFDIHGGGMDLQFPHHECEIAQCNASNQIDPVKYWLHANMLTFNGKRMSKSTGNSILPNELFSGKHKLLEKAYSPNTVRFFMLQAHYRSTLDISNDALKAAEKGLERLLNGLKLIKQINTSPSSSFDTSAWVKNCYNAMCDDFNSPILIAHLFDCIKFINNVHSNKATINNNDLKTIEKTLTLFIYDVLGLKTEEKNTNNILQNKTIQLLLKIRNQARENKNFSISDNIRDELLKMGVSIYDNKDNTEFKIQ